MASKPNLDEKRRRKRGAGRGDILKAALGEFADKGYLGTTTAGIARKAGVTQPLVHHHFSSKWQLWTEALAETYGQFRDQADERSSEGSPVDPVAQLKRRISAFIQFTAANPELGRIVVMETNAGGETFEYLYDTFLKPDLTAEYGRAQEFFGETELDSTDQNLLRLLVLGASIYPFLVTDLVKRSAHLDMRDPATAQRYSDLVTETLLHGVLADSGRRESTD